ncbi:hypothetical protein VP01_7760g1 [Puccinia sorghi]|uniref:Uncharacterized protein n=1 Tax=Puccinia sorghi TaxID=27349 RepID=A0A0L6UC85_9BASI|nr:hypothetical protein VP01_7760g1 [Puccinia sorghi]
MIVLCITNKTPHHALIMDKISCVIQCTHIVNSSFMKIINWKSFIDIYQKYNITSVVEFTVERIILKKTMVKHFSQIQKFGATNGFPKLILNEEKDDTALPRGRTVIVTSSSLAPLGASSPTRLFDPTARINFSIISCLQQYDENFSDGPQQLHKYWIKSCELSISNWESQKSILQRYGERGTNHFLLAI